MQLWRHAIHYVAEVILEGIARVKNRCSAIGRNAMSAGLQLLLVQCMLLLHVHYCTT